jgi:hypothetical integral membrane protein (TIGR02206 family)
MSTTGPFILFGQAHLITLLVVAAASIAVPILARGSPWAAPASGSGNKMHYRIGVLIAVLLIAQEALHIWLQATHYERPMSSLLPLHLCGLSVLLSAWVLVARSYLAYEIVYFWAWGGTLQALLTPDLDAGFPSLAFIAFFVGHGLVILAVLYATLVYRFRPRVVSIVKSLVALVAAAAVVAPVNLWLGSNYLFLSNKPEQASLMDYLGPWPWYILSLAGLALVSSVIYYLPFLIKDLISGKARRERSAGTDAE